MKNKLLGDYTSRSDCRFCEGTNLKRILDFGNVPLAGGFLKESNFAREKFYPLDLNFCQDCFLVQVSNVVPAEVLFKDYFYFSSSIGTLVEHCAEFAKETKERFLKDRKQPAVFEIGCNDGVLLKPFAAMGIRAVGVDPATNVVNSITSKDITVVNDFFSEKLALKIKEETGLFDAVLSSYSFAHIDDMVGVMKGVKHILKEDGVFIFEVYYLGTLIDEMQYDMIYHEHMSYYSLKTLMIFLKRFDMEIFDIKFTPGVRSGAVRFYAQNTGKRGEGKSVSLTEMIRYEQNKGFDRIDVFLDYAAKVNKTREQLLNLLHQLKGAGKTIIGYGASGRGTTIMNYCGIDGQILDYVVDDAPAKHGYFTPGTHVPIKPWEYTKETVFPEYALLFAWSFINEVKKRRADYLQQGGRFIVPLPQVTVVSK
ncbi:class I SAM-dependent methyltransferase [Candidatus Parcubacteria bacterium]|nr:MAG: class I SAM-dependent methyltransferase [Candidatus Parcubacteria bacterium]